ncbi:MAG: type VI secretion system baseplate subunit TssK [Polyangiaceae bacterium]|nr:type VI secretion system baseplate subunit TssK [Polyangiaceae bacterium]MCW5789248.1 type VI secretion system baseplate subunit TssK [Polyangiaceae bacterium]
MSIRKPVWTEGLFITQHHFQQLDAYHERLLDRRLSASSPYVWGVTEIQLDERALGAGQLKLTQLSAILPDGTPVSCGDRSGDAPLRDIGEVFTPQMQSLDVFIALPQENETAPNVDLEDKPNALTRFTQETGRVYDVNTGSNEQSFGWARANVRILFGEERRESFDSIKVAVLMRSNTGAIIAKRTYVPPVLRIGAAPFLTTGLRHVLENMTARQRSLAASRRQRSEAAIDFQASDVAKFWLLSTLNNFIPVIAHYVDQGRSHPEQVYITLSQLIGQLCTFAVKADPTDIPKFNYLELGDTFERLFARVLALLDAVIAERYVEVPMQRREDGMYLGKIEDGSLMRYEFFLAAKGSLPEGQLRDRLPKLSKIASWSQVGSILNSAINGARLELEYQPPGALPLRPGVVFFRVHKTPEYWTDIQGTGTIAIYQPLEPRAVELSLYAVDPENL